MPSETKDNEKNVETKNANWTMGKPSKEWLYVLGAIVLAGFIYCAGRAAGSEHERRNNMTTISGFAAAKAGDGPVTVGGGAGRLFVQHGEMGNSSMMDNADHFRGVVTSVSDKNFTIAGNGAATNVVTTSSTSYQNGNTVKQNDSVIVEGTKSGDTITATRIIINP